MKRRIEDGGQGRIIRRAADVYVYADFNKTAERKVDKGSILPQVPKHRGPLIIKKKNFFG